MTKSKYLRNNLKKIFISIIVFFLLNTKYEKQIFNYYILNYISNNSYFFIFYRNTFTICIYPRRLFVRKSMKLVFILLLSIFYVKLISANEIEVFELHDTKSLDQLVLDKINEEQETNALEATLETSNENNSNNTEQTQDSENNKEVSIQDIDNNKELFFINLTIEEIKEFLNYSKNIKSNVLKDEYFNYLLNLNLDLNIKKNREIFFILVEFFYDIGKISYSYNLINSYDLSNDKNIAYYEFIDI